MNGIANIGLPTIPAWGKIGLGALALIAVVHLFGGNDEPTTKTGDTNHAPAALEGFKRNGRGAVEV